MTVYALADIIGETLYVLKGPDTNQRALDRISVAIQSGERVTEDILNYRKNGSTFWARCTFVPVRLEGENLMILVSTPHVLDMSSKPALHWATAGDARPEDLAIEIQVSDTGVGIDEAFLPHLFVPFEHKSTGFSHSFEATGLGLSISVRLVHMLGGVILAETMKGEGSTFRVFLPQSL